jgi:hypothetical protein
MYNGGVIGVRRNRDQVENVDGRQAFEAIIIADYDARSIFLSSKSLPRLGSLLRLQAEVLRDLIRAD